MARAKNRGYQQKLSPSYTIRRWRLGEYIRLSKEDLKKSKDYKDDSNSVKNQRDLLNDFYQMHIDEFESVSEYVDDGHTGTDAERENFQRLLSDVMSGKINCVIVKDLSRFARNYSDAGSLIDNLFVQMGVRFISLAENVDSLIVIPNEQLKAMNNGQKMTFVEAFKMADEVLLHGVKSISELIKVPGFVNLDFADVTSIMKDAGYAHMGFAKASGKDKAAEAAKGSISSPLLETSISGAKGVIISFTAAPDVDLDDIEGAAALITEQAHPDADITWGIAFDDSMDDEMMITVIATGFEDKQKSAMYPEEQPKAEAPAAPAAQTEYVQTSIAQPAKPVAPEEPKKEEAPYIAKRPAEINPDDEFSIILDSFNR